MSEKRKAAMKKIKENLKKRREEQKKKPSLLKKVGALLTKSKTQAKKDAMKKKVKAQMNKKKTFVKGTMEGSPTNTTGSPYNKKKTNKTNLNNLVSNPQAVPGKKAVKKKAPIAPSMYGKTNQGIIGKAPKSNVVRPTYMKAVEQDKKRKKKRAQGRNQMSSARKSMGY